MAPLFPRLAAAAAASLTRALAPTPILARQSAPTATVTVVSSSGGQLSGGAIAGIVIGSIAGFLLLWWIIWSCRNLGAPPPVDRGEAWYSDVEPKRASRSSYGGHSHRRYDSPARRARSRRRHSSVIAVDPPVYREGGMSRSPRRPSPAYVYEEDYRGGRRGGSRKYYGR